MAYKHGVYVGEIPTAIIPPVQVDTAIAFIVGASPVNMTDTANVNIPHLFYSYDDAVKTMGFVPANSNGDFEYSISEVIYSQFALFQKAPIVFVNVLDATKHKTTMTAEALPLAGGIGVLPKDGILLPSVAVKNGADTAVIGVDYELTWQGSKVQVNAITGGALDAVASVTVDFDYLDPSKVTDADIIGGIDAATGKRTGLELLNEVFPRFRVVPSLVIAPGYSGSSAVAAVMKAKASSISGSFKALSLIDVPSDTVIKYQDVAAWKNTNNVTDADQIALWPMVALGGMKFHLSTQAIGVIAQTDADNDDIPYVSPSNKNIQADSTILADGTAVFLTQDEANLLNSNGVVTALNWIGGWKLWGNETAVYPAVTDVKDRFIPVRRMFLWKSNQLILTYFQKVDYPINRRLIDTIVDSENINLNSLVSIGALLGGTLTFPRGMNSDTDLLNGKVTFHLLWTPPVPAQEIEFKLEYDVTNFANLFN